MNNRERLLAVLNYNSYDRLPLLHFGFQEKTVWKWAEEGHISTAIANAYEPFSGNQAETALSYALGFDFGHAVAFVTDCTLPPLTSRKKNASNVNKAICRESKHIILERKLWDKHFRRRLQWSPERVTSSMVRISQSVTLPWLQDGLEFLRQDKREFPLSFFCGNLHGFYRNIIFGFSGLEILRIDDPELFKEILNTFAELSYRNLEFALRQGAKFDYLYFLEDICCKCGSSVAPDIFAEHCGLNYRRITDLAQAYGISIAMVDCQGRIDDLLPVWLQNGINTMFPIETGTWNGSIAPWRAKYGKEIRGIGGVNEQAFAKDHNAIDAEISKLKPLVAMGGYIPMPDHSLAPNAKWELVRYYCQRMREEFS